MGDLGSGWIRGFKVGVRGVSFHKVGMNNGLRVDAGAGLAGVFELGYWLGVIVR